MMQQRARQRASGDIERERASIVLREYAISLVCVACDLIQQSDDGSSGDNRYMVRGVYRVGDSHQLAARYIIIAQTREYRSISLKILAYFQALLYRSDRTRAKNVRARYVQAIDRTWACEVWRSSVSSCNSRRVRYRASGISSYVTALNHGRCCHYCCRRRHRLPRNQTARWRCQHRDRIGWHKARRWHTYGVVDHAYDQGAARTPGDILAVLQLVDRDLKSIATS